MQELPLILVWQRRVSSDSLITAVIWVVRPLPVLSNIILVNLCEPNGWEQPSCSHLLQLLRLSL